MPLTVCLCQPIWVMISSSVAPFLRWSIATTLAVLLPSRGPALSSVLAAFLALGAFLAAVVLCWSPWPSYRTSASRALPREILLAGKGIEGAGGRGGGFFLGAERRDVVLLVDRKRRHNRSPWSHALRGHHMDHSGCAHKQANNAGNRLRRCNGDDSGPRPQLAAFGI